MAIGACFVGVRGRRAGLVAALAAGLFAVGLAGAPGASALKFKHSAKSAELRDGRLILRGVSGRVSYLASSGRWATARLKRVHMGVFLPGRPATARLHEAGHRAGDDLSFRLTRPVYNAARRTVSFRARSLDTTARAADAARRHSLPAALSRLGRSSLTVSSHPTVAPSPYHGNACSVEIVNSIDQNAYLYAVTNSWSAWDTDTWDQYPPQENNPPAPGPVGYAGEVYWLTFGGDLRGCSNTVTLRFSQAVYNPPPADFTFTIETTWAWGASGPTSTCTPSTTQYRCYRADDHGQIIWGFGPG
jgi:hypothetical protein